MLFSVPITGKETIVDTPLNCRSIRSFYFHNRYGKTRMFTSESDMDDSFRGFVTITIDGRRICDNLWVLPFMDFPSDNIVSEPKDWRRIAIPCLKNTEMSEIKIETRNDSNLDFEVVFEYSDTEVESEHFYHIESYPFGVANGMPEKEDKRPYSVKLVNIGKEFQLQTHEEAEMIFVNTMFLDTISYMRPPFPLLTKEGFRFAYATLYYNSHRQYPSTYPFADFRLTISDLGDVMPSKMPLDLISVDGRNSWKDALYRLNGGLSKHPKFKLDIDGSLGPDTPSTIATIYLIHDCKF
ncbi:MAG: hypothetical protein MJZ30_10045 [Paludibacteraceae bacterium]|nr:hypothetical protein [Paludibacteraceae bacterium]